MLFNQLSGLGKTTRTIYLSQQTNNRARMMFTQ